MRINNVNPRTTRDIARRLSRASKLIRMKKTKTATPKLKMITKNFNRNQKNKHHHIYQSYQMEFSPKQINSFQDSKINNTEKITKFNGNHKNERVQKQVYKQQANIQNDGVAKQSKKDKKQQMKQKKQQKNKIEQQDNQQFVPLDEMAPDGQQKPAWYFSDKLFTDVNLSEPTMRALKKNNYKYMTHIQARTLPHLMRGKDVLGSAKTGSGKTLAYLIPCFEKLRELQFKQMNGTGVIIICPTRELAIQVFDVAKKIGQFHNKTIGLLIGGMNRKMESIRLQKGVNLLICTPGRLLDHLQNSNLVIDQADALLRIGFQQQITDILRVIPKDRQTVLFSATQTRKIQDLAKLSLQNPLYIGVDDMNGHATVESLQQGFVVINAADKFRLLITFLRKQKDKHKKIMIFFSSCNSVKFYSDLLNYVDISVMDIHGKQKQQKRSTTFYQFSEMKQGILLCTDVAARGLDIPQVDWIVQYDPPLDIREYIHRVGRTCRGHNAKGKALLFLINQQRGYLKHLLQSKVELNQYEFQESKLEKIQQDFELLISKNNYLYGEAVSAFKSYLHAYTTYSLKQVFNVHALDLKAVARSFGLVRPPHVDLNLKIGGSRARKLKELAKR